MKLVIITFLLSLVLLSCESDLITVLDEYNTPYEIKAIATNDGILISFFSGILASDFAGFNFYASDTMTSFEQTNDAITNAGGFLPTVSNANHVRELFEFQIPGEFQNGTLYNISVTAYGTNVLATDGFIETRIQTVLPVIPRPEGILSPIIGDGQVDVPNANALASISGSTITPLSPYRVQYFGGQTNFNDIVIITNDDYNSDFDTIAMPIELNSLYVFYNDTQFVKLWVVALSTSSVTFRWALQDNPSLWNGV